jgi:hypothetical protein
VKILESQNLPFTHGERDMNWMILFTNAAFIPKNEDIQKLNEAID